MADFRLCQLGRLGSGTYLAATAALAGRQEPAVSMLHPLIMRGLVVVPLLLALAACDGSDNPSSLGDAGPAAESTPRTVLCNVSYIGAGVQREQGVEQLQECLEQPGTAVTVTEKGSSPIRQVSVARGRDDIRRFEQCLLSVLNTTVERVPQQVQGSDPDGSRRSLADPYDEPPRWPGDPRTKNGEEISRDELVLAAGAEHCGWGDSPFVAGEALDAPRDQRGTLWVRDPEGVLDVGCRRQRSGAQPSPPFEEVPVARERKYPSTAKQVIITVMMPPDPAMLLDEAADRPGVTRSAYMRLARGRRSSVTGRCVGAPTGARRHPRASGARREPLGARARPRVARRSSTPLVRCATCLSTVSSRRCGSPA